jgi:uncharacterized LabA/DUF88 family protein
MASTAPVAQPPAPPIRTAVYVDGFNLFYGALKRRPHLKWLNIQALAKRILSPANQIVRIVYCTAEVKILPEDPQQQPRQYAYLRALKTIPHLVVVHGHFEERPTELRLVPPPKQAPVFLADGSPVDRVWVTKFEEKGSDVNLATHLLIDGFQNRYDLAVVISGDTDLEEPVRLADVSLRKKVALISPRSRLSERLYRHASFVRYLITDPAEFAKFQAKAASSSEQKRKAALRLLRRSLTDSDLAACQFPDQMTDADGDIHRPADWC